MAFAPLIVVASLLHVYIAWRLGSSLTDTPLALVALLLTLLASALAIPMGLPTRRPSRPQPLADRLTWIGMFFMGLFSTLLVLTFLRDIGLLAAMGVLLAAPGAFALEPLMSSTARAVPLIALCVTLWGLVNARRTAGVVTVEVPIRNLPPALHGFSIAQISDVHVGPTIKRGYVKAIVRSVNALGADMVAVTGDLVDGSVAELGRHVAPLAELKSRHGSFFVTGNHEYYSGAAAWVGELRRLGMVVLMNEHAVLRHAGADLVVAGVTDYSAGHFDPQQRSDPQRALDRAPPDVVRLLLAHQPRSAVAAAAAGFDLQLSGHTHGGQFWPWNLFVPLQQPYTAGLHRLNAMWVYTSRGTGYWGPPKRFGAPSEITHLRLVAA